MELQELYNLIPNMDGLKQDQTNQVLMKIRQTYNQIDDQSASFAMHKISEHIMRLKTINPQTHEFLEQCVKDIIRISVQRKFAVGSQALRNIFNAEAEYYRHSKLDTESRYPLGLRHPLNFYEPEVGEQCDIVKPHISSISYCGWTRATIISKDAKKYIVKYANSQVLSQTKQQPFCAPLGQRTNDFEWRMNLEEGDEVDAYHKVWYLGTVAKIQIQNGTKRVRVTFKIFNSNGAFYNKNGQRYDGLSDEEDQWYQVTSYRIQKPGKMSKKFCIYSLTSQQFIVDDTYDLIFQKQYQQQKFKAIMRLNLAKSQSFLEFYETFSDATGNQTFLNLLECYHKEHIDHIFNLMIVIANSSFLVPRMRVYDLLPLMLTRVVKFLYDNSKNLNPQRNQMASFFIELVSKRVISLSQKHLLINQIRKRLALDFLKLNMQKQMIALRLLYEIINPMPREYSQCQKYQADQFLRKNDIFYQLIKPNTHEQILLRSVQLIKYLLKNEIISFKQIEYLWNIYPLSDLRGKSTVQKMIRQLSKDFSIEDTKKLIDKILTYGEPELTVDNLGLLRSLKDHQELHDDQKLKILQFMWQIITLKSMNITTDIQEQIQKVFKSILPTLRSNHIKLKLFKLLLNRLSEVRHLNNQFQILKQFILTYPKKVKNSEILKIQQEQQTAKQIILQKQKVPSTISQVVDFLKQRSIYETIINIFNELKNPQKMKNVLGFTAFLFEHDKDNVNRIAKVFYDKMGPSDTFLDWGQHITQKAHQFFISSLGSLDDVSKFQNLSSCGFQALKVIIFDINIQQGNMKLIKKQKNVYVQSQANNQSSANNNANSSPKAPVCSLNQRPQTLTFLYLLKSPYQCKGVKFLEQLLCVVKNNKVYDQIIKLIIQFFVNLDQSIQDKTKQFREQFLMDIINNFKEINQKNEYSDKIKLRLQTSINLIQQLFAETQKEGLFDIKTHFECVQGQTLKFKIQNNLNGNQIPNFNMEINQNATLWSLKVKLAELLNQKPEQLNVYKFTNPIADEFNAKSISDLHFFNDECIKVKRKGAKEIPRKQLLSQTGESLSPKFNQIVQKWFNTYKNERDEMGMQELKRLSSECWRGSMLKQVSKLNQMLTKFDQNSKGYLDLQQFKQFFIFKSSQNQSAIWKIINLSGYRNNLRHKDQLQRQITPDIYPRRILSNPKVYETIFSILENKLFKPVHLNFYRLLALLQTDKNLKDQVKKNAKSLIEDQSSVFRLSYILETVLSEILVNDGFYIQFYRNKGCQFIFHKLQSFMAQNKPIYTFDTLIKTMIMPNMVKILSSYVFCLQSQNKMIRLVRKLKINQIELDFLSSQIKKMDQVIQEKNQLQYKLVLLRSIQQVRIDWAQYHQLAQKIYFNLVENFKGDLLQKMTNQIVRMYCSLSLSQNKLNRSQIIKGLKCQSLNCRRSCQNMAYLHLLNNQNQVKQFMEYLLLSLPQQNKAIYSCFFILLEKVLEMYLDLKKQDKDDAQFIQLAGKLFSKLLDEIPNENRNSLVSDKLLLGVLVVINILLTKREGVRHAFKHLKQELLQKCLFFYHPRDRIGPIQISEQMLKSQKQANHFNDYVKCKSQDTRKALMQIIFYLHEVSAQQDHSFVDQYILPIFNDLPKQKRSFETKTLQVGLNNLGSTCYLNSMLQVINAVKPFRNIVMQSESQAPLVKQLKRLFSYLFYSQRQNYIPEDLLKAFLPPIQKGIQQDTTQFLNILFDQLQACFRGTSQSNLLEEIFQGTQAAQMICHGCGQKRQRRETFFTYGVQIQGKQDLKAAFQGMHTGELIGDCLCQHCGQRSDTTKRTVIDVIPNLFFVHLKRIVFNYDVFMNTKIHSRLQFPMEVNFQPYTKQGLQLRQSLGVQYMKKLKQNQQQRDKFEQLCLHQKDKNYYKLKLKGIIVHSGGPQVGHYWAITKKQPTWLKLDDSRVTVFPNSNMHSECFGGNVQTDQWPGMGSSTNAYVLLYEKQSNPHIVLGQNQSKRVIALDKIETFNTAQLYKQVWLDNHSLMLQNHLLRDTYCRQFIHFLVQMIRITPSNSKVEVISQTLYKLCFHSGQTGELMDAFIQNIEQIQPHIFNRYILGEKQRTFDLLFHNNANVRDFAAAFIERVLIQTFKKGSDQDRNNVTKFIGQYLLLLHHDVAKNWLRIDGYFRLFEGLVTNSLGVVELHQFLIDKHLIGYFIDFILQKSSPLSIYPKKYSIGTKSNPAQFGNAIKMIFFLIKRSYGLTGQNYQVPAIEQKDLHHLSDSDVLCLSSIGFYGKMLRERQNLHHLGMIIQSLSIKNILFSQAVARVMLITLNQITDAKDQMMDICDCISKYLIISDEYWIRRAEFILGYSSPYVLNDNLLSSLDEQRFVYYSTLQDLFPVECLLAYCHINRLRNPLSVLHILKIILQGCSVNETSKQYLLSQKSSSYLNERYLDWVKPYVNTVVQRLNISKDKKQVIIKQVDACNSYITGLQVGKQPLNNIITGKIGNTNVVDSFANQDNTIEVVVSNVQAYCLQSEPTGAGNVAFDQYLKNGRLNKKVNQDSNILCFFKEFSKPLAIKQAVQEAQDKWLESLFDDCTDKKADQKNNQKQISGQNGKEKSIAVQVQQVKEPSANTSPQVKIVQQQKKQQITHQIQIPEVQLIPDYFRKIQIINNSNKNKRVRLLFKTVQDSNMVVPSKVCFISTKKAVETMWICKIDSKKSWGTVDYQLIVEQKQPKPMPKSFKLYSKNNSEYQEPQPMEIKIKIPVSEQHLSQNQANPQANEPITEISCPICTFFNLSTQTNCEVCGSSMSG